MLQGIYRGTLYYLNRKDNDENWFFFRNWMKLFSRFIFTFLSFRWFIHQFMSNWLSLSSGKHTVWHLYTPKYINGILYVLMLQNILTSTVSEYLILIFCHVYSVTVIYSRDQSGILRLVTLEYINVILYVYENTPNKKYKAGKNSRRIDIQL